MKGDICSIEGCSKIVRSSNICAVHAWRMKTYGSYNKPSRKIFGDKCKVEGCNNHRDLKQRSSLCTMHRVRMSRHKSFELPNKKLPDGVAYICQYHGELNFDQAYLNPKNKYYSCKKCRIESREKLIKNNPNKDFNATKKYWTVGRGSYQIKMLKTDYNKMLENQNGVCKLCDNPETMKTGKRLHPIKRLAIDHNRKTGFIRGLLCHFCNTQLGIFESKGLGYFASTMELANKANNYLKEERKNMTPKQAFESLPKGMQDHLIYLKSIPGALDRLLSLTKEVEEGKIEIHDVEMSDGTLMHAIIET